MKVVVKSYNNINELDAQPTTKCRDIYLMLVKYLQLHEPWYFGLCYEDRGSEYWIDSSKKTMKDIHSYITKLNFKIKCYPESIGDEPIERVTTQYLYLQAKSLIVGDEVYCPPDTSVLLASYSLQAKHGDFKESKLKKKILNAEKLLPERVLKQHAMSTEEFNDSILKLWTKHKGMDDEEAMLEYLKLCLNLEMFGVTYYKIKNRNGTDVILGITALGVNIYKEEDKMNPQITFPWSEIKSLNIKDSKFTIKLLAKKSKDFIFTTASPRTSKTILNLSMANHTLYCRRRKPEAPDITKLRERAMEQRAQRKSQRDQLNSERLAREDAERRERDYLQQIQNMRQQMDRDQAAMRDLQEIINRLQKQLDALQKSKIQLEKERQELKDMMERLEHNKHLEEQERQKLEDEIRAKHAEVQRIQDEVRRRDEEARRLKEEVEAAKRQEEELKALRLKEEEERRLREQEELERRERGELDVLPDGANTNLPETQQIRDSVKDEFKLLQEKMKETRSGEHETDLDKIYQVNLTLGKDKFKTLADIRRGNTVRRIEMFENM